MISSNTSATLAGTVNITRCPTGNTPGTTATVGATATNTGDTANNSFVILITAARSDNGTILASGYSANLDLLVGATSAEFTITFTVPGVNVNVVYELRADPAFSYCVPSWQCESPLNGYESDGCGNRRTNSGCNPACVPSWQCESPLNGYESDGCGNRRTNSGCNPACVPSWGGGTWGACQSGNIQYKTQTDGCGNSRVVSQYCLYAYAAEDGSTPIGTVVCNLDVIANPQGTIYGWNGSKYIVNMPGYGINMNVSPSRLKLGPC